MGFTGISTAGYFTSFVTTVPAIDNAIYSTKAAKTSVISVSVTDVSAIGLSSANNLANTSNSSFMTLTNTANTGFTENITDTMSQNTTSFQHIENETLFWMVGIISLAATAFIAILGLFGTIFTIIIMRREPFRSSSYGIHLIALAVADMVYLISITFYKESTIYFLDINVTAHSVIICKMFFYSLSTTRGFSSLNIVFISVERFIAVWFPFKAKYLSSKRTTLNISGCLFVAANIVAVFVSLSSSVRNGICLPIVPVGGLPLSLVGYTVLFVIIPTIILLVLTPLTIFKLARQQLLRRRLNCENGVEHLAYITAMLIGTVIAYIVLVCCPTVARVVLRFTGMTPASSYYMVINEILSIIEQINCSVNFFIYGMLCSKFRNQFISIFTGLC